MSTFAIGKRNFNIEGTPMIFPESYEEKTGFESIRKMILAECRNDISGRLSQEMTWSIDPVEVNKMTGETEEYLKMLTTIHGHPDPVIQDHTQLLSSIRIPGTWFEPELLPDFHESLEGLQRYLTFFQGNEDFHYLRALSKDIEVHEELVEETGSILDEHGEIRDTASPELARIRKEIAGMRAKSERTMRRILKEAVASGVIQGDTAFTVKNGRYVIPVPAARKRQLSGYIHDESGTGQTIFIEPAEILELFNEVRELELAARREIIKIMTTLADRIRPHLDDLQKAFLYGGHLDFIRAKARLAIRVNGVKPELVDVPIMDWKGAIHPLLYLSLKEQGRSVVPLDITLTEKHRILIISGPNAGGKSVCLKTAGLLQYMLQCGMLIPVQPGTKAGIFRSLFIDIGDQQSIENDLSTYSSHLMNIGLLLKNADHHTLFLIDEMGSGTEPTAGGALAEAALELMASTGALGIVTTHYANLKLMGGRVQGISSGAMLFDTNNMQPLYKLRTGKPGSSFAFEIARKTGLPETLLSRARKMTGKDHYDFEFHVQQLETEREEMERKYEEIKVADAFVTEMIEKYSTLYQQLDRSRKEILEQARAEAKHIIDRSNKLIEKTVKEIREESASRDRVKTLRDTLRQESERLEQTETSSLEVKGKAEVVRVVQQKNAAEARKRKIISSTESLKKGDIVNIKGHKSPGEVLGTEGDRVEVAFGDIRMKLNREQLEWSDIPLRRVTSGISYKSVIQNLSERSNQFKPELDLRGKRAEEALTILARFLDDALLLSVKNLRVLHGKGDGILRQVIRDHLSGMKEVKSFTDEHIERGGHGITIIKLH